MHLPSELESDLESLPNLTKFGLVRQLASKQLWIFFKFPTIQVKSSNQKILNFKPATVHMFLKDFITIYKQKVLICSISDRLQCQLKCQQDSKCKSCTYNEPNSPNPSTCVLNYGPTLRRIDLPSNSGIASAPKYCQNHPRSKNP